MTSDLEKRSEVDLFGPRLSFEIGRPEDGTDYCVMHASVPPGGFIPLHAHSSRETFYVLAGELEGWLDGEWRRIGPSRFFDIPTWSRHALRNRSDQPVEALVTTNVELASFLARAGRQVLPGEIPAPPCGADFERFDRLAANEGVWIGTAVDNEAIGIALGPPPS